MFRYCFLSFVFYSFISFVARERGERNDGGTVEGFRLLIVESCLLGNGPRSDTSYVSIRSTLEC